jgi:hypothetical protein
MMRLERVFWRKVYYLVPPPPSPLVFWNHEVSGIFLTWSLILKGLYQSILE